MKKPLGKWKCQRCGDVWNGSELFYNIFSYPESPMWLCGHLGCNGVCRPMSAAKQTGEVDRVEELQEMKEEFILNESVLPENPSWGELAEAQAEAERKWDETENGKELKALLGDL